MRVVGIEPMVIMVHGPTSSVNGYLLPYTICLRIIVIYLRAVSVFHTGSSGQTGKPGRKKDTGIGVKPDMIGEQTVAREDPNVTKVMIKARVMIKAKEGIKREKEGSTMDKPMSGQELKKYVWGYGSNDYRYNYT